MIRRFRRGRSRRLAARRLGDRAKRRSSNGSFPVFNKISSGSCGGTLCSAGRAGGGANGRRRREKLVAGSGESTDNEHPNQPDEDSDKNGDKAEQNSTRNDRSPEGLMIENCNRNTPPGEHGVHSSSEQPSTEEIPDSMKRRSVLIIWGKQSSNPSEVNCAESNSENGSPTQREESEITEQIGKSELGSREIEKLEREKSGNNNHAKSSRAAEMERGERGEKRRQGFHDKPPKERMEKQNKCAIIIEQVFSFVKRQKLTKKQGGMK